MASNLALLEDAANKLKVLLNEVVFVGGSTLDLLVTDQGAAPIRGTVDVDVIVEITTYGDTLPSRSASGRLAFLKTLARPPLFAAG